MSANRSAVRSLCVLILYFTYAAFASGAFDNSAVLKVDGILRVSNNAQHQARLIILPADGPAEVVTDGLARFDRSLDLQTSYLMEFAREGCVTKQLMFDTHVPDEFLAKAPFDFPFQVTLEAPPRGQSFHYAGPVGFIHFEPADADFAYDKDYTKYGDEKLIERMEVERARIDALTPLFPATISALPHAEPIAIVTAEPLAPPAPRDSIADTEASSAPMVHRTAHTEPEIALAMMRPKRIIAAATPSASPLQSLAPTSIEVPMAPRISGRSRSEELLVEKLRVTTVTRICDQGHTTEYRKVAHRYGAVFFFKDGSSCDRSEYERGLGQP